MKAHDDIIADRVHDVANHCNGGNKGNDLIHEFKVVAIYISAHHRCGVGIDNHIVASFRKCKKEGEEKGHEYNPMGDIDAGGKTSYQHAQYEADSNDEYVDDSLLL